jgi:hypothetical protein
VIVEGTKLNRLPEAGAGFVWDDEDGVLFLRPATERVTAAFTTRVGGVSASPYDELNLSFRVGDEERSARTNREIAGRAISRGADWSVVRQMHGADVVPADDPGRLPSADGQWTDNPGRTLAVLGADCIPVLLVAPGRVAVVHAGWRGILAGVVENAVGAMNSRGKPHVFLGPAIGPCCYEVGAEVAGAFRDRFGREVFRDERLDLCAAAASAAREGGSEDVASTGLCTSCHSELFFSHRRDKGRTGRQALLARLSDD